MVMNVKKILSVLLVITIILPVFAVSADVQAVAVSDNSQTVGINYDMSGIVISGTVDGNVNTEYFIDLKNETITVPTDYKITAYSINNGKSWISLGSKTFNNTMLEKLFSKDFTLVVTDKYNSKTKTPESDAKTVKFAKINKRPTLKNYYVNYLIGADSTGETSGTWVLTEKNGTTSVKENIEIAVSAADGKTSDSKGYGRFYGANGTSNGIEIAELSSGNKVVSKTYFIRSAAAANPDGTYTAASSPRKISVKGQPKPSTYKVNKTKKTISYSANTYIFTNKTELKKSKGELKIADGGDIYLWSAATATSPASAMQKTSVTPGDKAITFTDSTVTTLPSTAIGESAVVGEPPIQMSVRALDSLIDPAAAGVPNSIIILSPAPNTQVKVGESIPISAQVLDDGNNPVSANLTWSITSGSDFAMISGFGLMATVTGKGTPNATGETVKVQAAYPGSLTATIDITVIPAEPPLPNALVMTPNGGPLKDGEIGTAYSENISVSGGPTGGNVTWEISQIDDGTGTDIDALPPGLYFDAGTIYGTPTAPGQYGFSITAKKGTGTNIMTITRAFTINVYEVFNITFNVDSGKNGKLIARNETDKGELLHEKTTTNSESINIRMSSNIYFTAIPDTGYRVKEWKMGKESDDPTTVEENGVTYISTGYSIIGLTGATTVIVEFEPIPLEITTTTLPKGKKNYPVEYSATLEAKETIGTRRWSWEQAPNTDPSLTGLGLTMSTDGKITGIPTKAGTYTVTVNLEDLNTDKTVRVATKKVLILTILNEIVITYKRDAESSGTGIIDAVANDSNAMKNISPDKEKITLNTWEEDTVTFTVTPHPSVTLDKWTYGPENVTDRGVENSNADNTVFTSRISSVKGKGAGDTGTDLSNPRTLDVTVSLKTLTTKLVHWGVGTGSGNLEARFNGTTLISDTEYFLPPGQSITFTAVPGSGYRVESWVMANNFGFVDDSSTGGTNKSANLGITGNSYTLSNPTYTELWIRVNFTMSSPPQIDILPNDTAFLPNGTIGEDYSFTFDVPGKDNYAVLKWDLTPAAGIGGLTLDPITGEITGIIYSTGKAGETLTFTVTVTGTLKTGGTSTRTRTYNILLLAPKPLVISPTMPDGIKGFPYSEFIQYTGSALTKDWVIKDAASLPPGLSFDTATGKVSGTPTAAGTFTFEITGENSAGKTTQTITIKISEPVPPLNIQPDILPDGTVKIPYTQTLTASGLPASFTWSIIPGGALPPGVSLDSDTGEIKGTPTITGKYTFTVSADNKVVPAATQEYTITINALAITPNPPNGAINEPYSHKFTLNGNVSSTVTWSWSAASGFILPPGLEWNSATGEITGTPTVVGTYRFDVTATGENNSFTEKRQFTIKINAFSPPVITTNDVLYGEVGVKFWEILEVDGNPPIEWEWTDSTGGKGNIPPGLVLSDLNSSDPARAQYGIISGIPTTAGFYNITVSAISCRGTDNESVGTKNIVIVIRGSIDVTSITGVPAEATTNIQTTIKATVNPRDATYQSIIWTMATMKEIIEDIEKAAPVNAATWITELRKLLSKAGISQSSTLLNLTDNKAFITELARRVGVTIPATADLSVSAELLAAVKDIIKMSPPYGDVSLTQNNIRKSTSGTVWFKATVKNGSSNSSGSGNPDFVRYFPIEFKGFVPVLNITGVPTDAVAEVPLTLTGEVQPYTATNTTIVWEIKWTDITGGVILQNGVLTAANSGNVMVTARIRNGTASSPDTDYTKDFLIKVAPPIPVVKVAEPQSDMPETGVAGKADYSVETKYIADGVYAVTLNSPHAGITLDTTTNIQIKNGKGKLTIYSTAAVPANTYSLSIGLTGVNTTDGRTVVNVASNNFAFKVVIPPDPVPPTIIRPSELADGTFPPKEPVGSMAQLQLPNGSMNVQYNETLLTKGFEYKGEKGNEIIPPTYWRIIGGSLPPGLSLTQWIEGAAASTAPPTGSTGWDTGYARAGCVIEGKPTQTGVGKVYTFIVETDEIVYFQRGTTVVWQKAGYTANPNAEKITWNSGGVNTVVFSGKKAVRTISILIEPKIYYPATGVTITPATLKVPLGRSESLAANVLSTGTGAPHNAASIQTVTWQTSNPRVATVDSFGNVYGVSEGMAIITANTSDKNITAMREVTVFNTPITGVSLSKSTMTLNIGGTSVLTATVRPAGATNKAVSFDSENLNVATVDEYGRITAVGEGKTVITVSTMGGTDKGESATARCTVTVQDAPLVRATKISINKTVANLTVGESEILLATILPANASRRTVTWKSSNPDLVSVDSVTGRITARAITTTPVIITVKVDQTGLAVQAECRVDVGAAPVVEKLSLNKTVTRLIVGESEILTAKVLPESVLKRTVTWKSSNPDLVSVDPATGRITARAITTTPVIITAKVDQSGTLMQAECRVDVIATAVIEKISLNKTAAVIPVGMTEMLTATLTPVHSIEYNRDNLIWRSLDVNIATVDSQGNITGKTVGTTVIEVGTTNGLTAKCTIEVTPLSAVVPTFVDVNSSEWYFSYVSQATAYGLVKGIGNEMFAPTRNVTRAEFVTMVVRALNMTSYNNVNMSFRDVNSDDWHYSYIKIALAEGLLKNLVSDGNNNFYPNRAIRREEMAVILAAAARKQGLSANLSPSTTSANPTNPVIRDNQLITSQYIEDINLVYKLGLMNGFPDGTFDPQGVSTRAQAATVMVRLYHEVARFF